MVSRHRPTASSLARFLNDLFRCRAPFPFAIASRDVDRDGHVSLRRIVIARDFEASFQEHPREPLLQFRSADSG